MRSQQAKAKCMDGMDLGPIIDQLSKIVENCKVWKPDNFAGIYKGDCWQYQGVTLDCFRTDSATKECPPLLIE